MEVFSKYFDEAWFKKILDYKEQGQLNKVIQNSRLYIKKYPEDISAIGGFTSLLLDLGLIEEAREIIEKTVITESNKKRSENEWIFVKIKLLGCQGKFEECYKLLQEHREKLINTREDFMSVEVYLQKKLGLPIKAGVEKCSYTVSQIIDYSDERAIEHIKTHQYGSTEDKSLFSEDFNIEENFYRIKEIISKDENNKMYSGIFKNFYIFKYINCGTRNSDSGKVDYINVITLQDTNEIITMFPRKYPGLFPVVDITPLEKTKVKKLSQIEKFNKKYGL